MKQVLLTNGGFALVDDEDFARVTLMRWRRTPQGYAASGIYDPTTKNTQTILMHRFVINAPSRKEVDHWDREGLNNQKYNLRLGTRSLNNGNSVGWNKQTSSQFKGVTWHKIAKKWMVRVANRYVGLFADEIDAATAYDKAAKNYYGEFALLNIVEPVQNVN